METYPLARSTWAEEELGAIRRVLTSKHFTLGHETDAFEREFAAFVGTKFAIMVNSGSSANLAMIAALLSTEQLQPGDEVIVPVVSWNTTYAPLYQLGLRMRFIDVDSESYNMTVTAVKHACTEKTKAVFFVGVLGSLANLGEIVDFCKTEGLICIADQCEALLPNQQYIADMTSYSMFFSHHICTIEGGMVTTNSPELYNALRLTRDHGWQRAVAFNSLLPTTWEGRYRFLAPGFNIRPTEISAAIGREQLKKLPAFLDIRQKNFFYAETVLPLSMQKDFGNHSYFAIGVTTSFRNDLVDYLEKKGIQTRPIICGNILRQPVYDGYYKHRSSLGTPSFKEADHLDRCGFYLGNYGMDLSVEIDYTANCIKDYFGSWKLRS